MTVISKPAVMQSAHGSLPIRSSIPKVLDNPSSPGIIAPSYQRKRTKVPNEKSPDQHQHGRKAL